MIPEAANFTYLELELPRRELSEPIEILNLTDEELEYPVLVFQQLLGDIRPDGVFPSNDASLNKLCRVFLGIFKIEKSDVNSGSQEYSLIKIGDTFYFDSSKKVDMKTDKVFLLPEFKKWLEDRVTPRVVSDYSSRLKKLNREFISHINTGTKDSPLQKLEEFMTKSIRGPKINLIEELLEAINSSLNKELLKLQNDGSKSIDVFRSERTAFRRYADFLKEYVRSRPYRKNKISPTEDAIIKTINGAEIIWDKDDLINNFALRLDTQDRPTGDKTLLPLGLLKRVFDKGVLREWSKAEAEKVEIHLASHIVKVKDIYQLKINTQTGKTSVLIDNVWADVFNPPINNNKDLLYIRKLNDAHLDHDPEIDTVLRNLTGQLPRLEELTKWIRDTKKKLGLRRIDSKNCDKIYDEILKDSDYNLLLSPQFKNDLMTELNKVTAQHKIQLASSEWNLSTKKQANKRKIK